jgi:YD repeat-containing protein
MVVRLLNGTAPLFNWQLLGDNDHRMPLTDSAGTIVGGVGGVDEPLVDGTGYVVEVHWKHHGSEGYGEIYVDGELVASEYDLNTTTYGWADTLRLGVVYRSGGNNLGLLFDDVEVGPLSRGVDTLLDLTYGYDMTGSVTSINNGTYTETYGYDLLDRLNETVGSWGAIGYVYDAVGNRLTRSVEGGSTVTYAYDCMDRIVSVTGLVFDWDCNGNMVYMHDGVNAWNYTYDPVDRLKRVYKDDVLSSVYTYDAGGRRVRSWDTVDGTTDYVYSGLNIIDEISSGSHEMHVYAGGIHIASNSSGPVAYYHVDHLGSTRVKTNSTGGVVYTSNYEPYRPGCSESGSEVLPT